jgi:TonB family protein
LKNSIISIILLLSCSQLLAQTKTQYLDYSFTECKKKNASYIMEISTINDSITKKIKYLATYKTKVIYKFHKKYPELVYSYNYSGFYNTIENEGLFINQKKEGEWMYYNSQGNLTRKTVFVKDEVILEKYLDSGLVSMEIPYKHGRYDGEGKIYYKGVLVKMVTFKDGFLVSKEDLVAKDSINDNDSIPKLHVEIMPTFIGGESEMMNFISKNVVYPKKAIANAIEGTVKVKFTVDQKGNVKDLQIISKDKLGYGCEEEAMRVIRIMPRWNPGLQNGEPVNVYFHLPIKFRLF